MFPTVTTHTDLSFSEYDILVILFDTINLKKNNLKFVTRYVNKF